MRNVTASSSPAKGLPSRTTRNARPFGLKEWTTDEILAYYLGIKIRFGLSDEAFFALIEGENASVKQDTVSRLLPLTRYKVSKELDGMIPFNFQYVTYCHKCSEILGCSSEPQKEAVCNVCGDLTPLLCKGGCTFVILPVRKQIVAYCSRPKFQSLVRKFKTCKYGKLTGPNHDGVVETCNFSLTVATDGATLSQWSNTDLQPLVMFFNNIPVSYQIVYPILAALYCGPKRFSPNRHVFFKYLVEELRDLEENPIQWQDDLGNKITSISYVTLCTTDAVEKSKVMNHKGHSGYFSCPYCKYRGENVKTSNTSQYPKKGTKKKKPQQGQNEPTNEPGHGRPKEKGSIRFPKLTHVQPIADWRSGEERLKIGQEIATKVRETGIVDTEGVEGVMGLGVLNMFPKFDETSSHTAGILHLVCEGIFKDIVNLSILTEGEPYSLKKKGGNWDSIEALQSSRTRVSEANYNCKSPRNYTAWRGYDYYQLLIHDVALLFSDETIITEEKFQKVVFLLSESVYYLCHGRMTDGIRYLARRKVEEFSEKFKEYFGPEWCTYKFHVFQHTPDLADRHGPAFLWDDFNLERINCIAKNMVTGTRGQMGQVSKHFIIRHHSDVLQDPTCYQESVQEQMKKIGFHQEVFYTYDDFITDEKDEPLDGRLFDEFKTYLVQANLCEGSDLPPHTRVTRMVRKNVVVLTSEHYKHRGMVRDFYVQVEGKVFGIVKEILYCRDLARFFLIIGKYVKYDALYSKGNVVLHPVNNFPYRTTDEIVVFELNDDLFIQKAQISVLVLADGTIVNLFSPRPNEYFRF